MNRYEYNIELITPCLCAGADQLKAEIRVPSIRGQIRWWFRALRGSRGEEKTLFGSVHGEAEKSKATFRLAAPLTSSDAKNLDDLVGRGNMNHPQAYLLWPLRPTRTSPQKRGMIPAGRTFVLRCAVDSRFDDDSLARKLKAAIEAWILLGALGTRSRRGYGSVGLHDGAPETPEELRIRIRQTLEVFGRPDAKVMLLSGRQDNADAALNFLGNWLREFRAGSKKSVSNPGPWGRNDHDAGQNRATKVYRPAIGLPVSQRYGGGTVVETTLEGADRWASPVHLKVMRCGGGYYPLAAFFPAMAIPEETKVRLAVRRERTAWELPVDHGLLREMMKPTLDAFVLWEA